MFSVSSTAAQDEGKRPRLRRWLILLTILVLGVGGWQFAAGRSAVDPDAVGRAETRMWRAYYTSNETEIAVQLVEVLRRQYGLNRVDAVRIAEKLARSAMAFKPARGNYEAIVLPDLTEAYRLTRAATGLPFDPDEAARAELAWWVARRTPGQNSPEQVGAKIAELYAVLYGSRLPEFERAGRLRAQAAALRDAGGAKADWDRVEALLKESYREVAKRGRK